MGVVKLNVICLAFCVEEVISTLLVTVNLIRRGLWEEILERSAAVKGDMKSLSVPLLPFTLMLYKNEDIVSGLAFQCLQACDN